MDPIFLYRLGEAFALFIGAGIMVFAATRCKHSWEDQGVQDVTHWDNYYQQQVHGQKMIQRCSKCGKFRRIQVW